MTILLLITISILIYGAQSKAVQERAMVSYYDPKYIRDPQAFTGRLKRGDPYSTNVTATILHPWGNNVTFTLIYASKRTGNDRILEVKCCDMFSQAWIADFIWTYFHIRKTCPFPAGTYSLHNLELPPRNFPFALPKGEFQLIAYFSLMESKRLIIKFTMKALQERATVNYYDPKYIKDPQAFTGRLKRGDPYRSNITATSLHPWGNNVTFTLIYASKRTGNDRILEVKCCDMFSQAWLEDFIWTYFHIRKTCPFPAGTYSVYNLELPPRNFPLPVPKGEAQLIAYFSLTESKRLIVKYTMKINHY